MEKPFSAYRGDKPYVFVCYAHEDAGVVYPELQSLRDQGVNIWYDEGIAAGTNWRAEIGGALDGAGQVLCYLSKASISSDHCNREINYALDEAKQIVPVLLDDTPLSADLKIGLSRVQMIYKPALSATAYQQALTQALAASRASGANEAPADPTAAARTPTRKPAIRWVAIAAAVALIGAFAAYQLRQSPAEPAVTPLASAEEPQAAVAQNSIAVLPFVNMSSDPEQEYFSDGISEELLNLLAKNPELKVISRSSAFTFKGKDVDIPTVAERLGVAHVLEGSVRKAGNTVRITAQLIDAKTDSHLWSETYDRKLDDIFAIQDEIAGEVVKALNLTLFGIPATKPAVNLHAYTLYLQGRYLRQTGTPENLQAAEAMLKEALTLDPNYAEAWIEIAQVYVFKRMASTMLFDEAWRLSRHAIERARNLDPENANVYAHLARDAIFSERDLAAAAGHLERGIALEPTNLFVIDIAATLALNLGRLGDAEALAEYVTAHDPLCANCFSRLGSIYLLQEKLDQATSAFETMELLGGGRVDNNLLVALALLLQGKHEASLATCQQANRGPFRSYIEAITLYSMGREEEFADKFQELKDQYGADYPTMVARVYAWMGDTDTAFEWLDRYHVEHPELGPVVGNYWELLSVELQNLHSDPRWHAHLQKLGIAPEQLAAFEFEVPLPD